MQIDLDTLPDDPALLQQMLRDVVAAAALRQAALQGCVQEREAENDKLRLLIQRHREAIPRREMPRSGIKAAPAVRPPVRAARS